MIKRAVMHWIVGIVAVAAAVALAKSIGLKLGWPNAWGIVVFVPVLAFANATVGPILKLMALPISCMTFGLIGFVINALVFWLAGAVTGAQIGFLSALFGSVVVSLIGALLSQATKEKR